MAIAGDEPADVAALADRAGFDAVVAGRLAEGVRFEPGTELFGADLTADEVRAALDRFPGTGRGRVIAGSR